MFHITIITTEATIALVVLLALIGIVVSSFVQATYQATAIVPASGADGTCGASFTSMTPPTIALLTGYTMGGVAALGLVLLLSGLIMLALLLDVHELASGLSIKVITEVGSLR